MSYAFLTEGQHSRRIRERGCEGRQARCDNPVHSGGAEARGRLFYGQQRPALGFIFLEIQDAAQIPAIAEPWFLAFNASIEIHPVMVPEDLARAGSAIDQAVKTYA